MRTSQQIIDRQQQNQEKLARLNAATPTAADEDVWDDPEAAHRESEIARLTIVNKTLNWVLSGSAE